MDYQDRIFALLNKLRLNANKADMHSFTANIPNGTVFVELQEETTFFIETITYDKDGKECRKQFAYSLGSATIALEMFRIDLSTVEF